MGTPKQLLRVGGVSLVRRAASELQNSRCATCFAVVGACESEVVAELSDLAIETISNPSWEEGIGCSIRCALDEVAARGGFDAALLTLADQPFVSREHLDALIDAFRGSEREIVASRYAGTVGVPALFGSNHFAALRGLSGDRGAKALLEAHEGSLDVLEFEAAALDIDTPEDCEALLEKSR